MRKLVAVAATFFLSVGTANAVPHPDRVELRAARDAGMQFWQHHKPWRWKHCKDTPPRVLLGNDAQTHGYHAWTPDPKKHKGVWCRKTYINRSYAKSVSRVRLCSTVTHELGHTMNLHHSKDPHNIMYYDQVPQRQVPKSCHYSDPHGT